MECSSLLTGTLFRRVMSKRPGSEVKCTCFLFGSWQSRHLHELELPILARARSTNLLLGKLFFIRELFFSVMSERERWEFFLGFSVFSFSINSSIKLMIALLPVSVLEQTQSLILKQEGSLFGTFPWQSLLLSPQHFLLLTVMLFYSIFRFPVPGVRWRVPSHVNMYLAACSGLKCQRQWGGQLSARSRHEELSGEFWVCCQHGWRGVRDKSRWMDLEEGRVEERSGERESKARETKFELPSSSVQSHSSTRQISLKYPPGLGSSVSSAKNGVSSSASSC